METETTDKKKKSKIKPLDNYIFRMEEDNTSNSTANEQPSLEESSPDISEKKSQSPESPKRDGEHAPPSIIGTSAPEPNRSRMSKDVEKLKIIELIIS